MIVVVVVVGVAALACGFRWSFLLCVLALVVTCFLVLLLVRGRRRVQLPGAVTEAVLLPLERLVDLVPAVTAALTSVMDNVPRGGGASADEDTCRGALRTLRTASAMAHVSSSNILRLVGSGRLSQLH